MKSEKGKAWTPVLILAWLEAALVHAAICRKNKAIGWAA